ncbi:MAG: bifunctional diguanylate cyclase/phosphodiesterase [Hydrogenothermaceae bacterium]|nr:bifunctional diguanylate cyclase/phosphodiesterase [Hydrogenothermaceae bacterium]
MLNLILKELSRDKTSISVILLSIVIYILIVLNFSHIEEKIHSVVVNREFNSIENFSSSVLNVLSKRLKRIPETEIKSFTMTNYNSLSEILETLNLRNVEYTFLLMKVDDKFMVWIDASRKDRLLPFTPIQLLPEEENVVNEILKTKKPQILIHRNIETMGITLYKPFFKANQILAILVIDFSIQKLQEIKHILSVIKKSILALIGISILSLNIIFISAVVAVYHHRKSIVDNLTKVYNRNFLEDLKKFLELQNYIVLLIDVDFFKKINDTYGHDVGDKVLKEVVNLMKNNIRKDDILIRYGGEEFLLFMKKGREQESYILNSVERLRSIIENYKIYISDSDYIKTTVSIGVNLSTDKMKDIDEAIKKADVALYKAKHKGRNRIEIYDEVTSSKQTAMKVSEIKQALEDGRLVCIYQPIVDIDSGEISHFEALVRIVAEDGSLITPYQFINVIENTFLYSKLTKEIIEYNISVLNRYKDISLSINLKPADILNQSTVEYLLSIITPDLRGRLMIEIVETEDILTYDMILKVVERFRNAGYEICIDDFGSGYSNFVYLLKLRVDYLKLDANLIRNIHKDNVSRAVVKMINEFCKNMGIKVIAEFVENENILNVLKNIGIKYGQGYYFSKPEPIENFLK